MNEEKIKRIIYRERSARKESERLLELKSAELYEINQNLEKLVLVRTKKLEQALEDAKEAIKAKDEFLSNMSHEIRTPLNAIIGFIEIMMQQDYDKERFSKQLNIIGDSSKHLLQIINNILDFSKLKDKKFILDITSVDLKNKLEHAYTLFSLIADKKMLEYEIHFSSDFPSYLCVDETKIIQVFSNFVSNAIKFTSQGEKVEIYVNYSQKTNYLELIVKDTGIGIDADAKNKVFDSFVQEDASVTREFGGTGLGLAISKEFIELMGGKIIFESTKDVGSTFGFKIPAKLCYKEVDVLEKSSEKNGYQGPILIAEDNEMSRLLMEAIMDMFEIEYDMVINGEEAVEAVLHNDYRLVLMDNQMPKLSGKEATRQIRKFNKTVPIVALSANVLKNEQQTFLDVGMNDALAKPIEQEELKKVLDKYLRN